MNRCLGSGLPTAVTKTAERPRPTGVGFRRYSWGICPDCSKEVLLNRHGLTPVHSVVLKDSE